jgi:DNA-binding MarR family transcriptional regulator
LQAEQYCWRSSYADIHCRKVPPTMSPSDADIQNIDRLIHEPSRLTIMMNLYIVESADFQFLQHQTGMTPGNLSSHLRKLEDAGYVEVTKEFVNRTPHTALRLTRKGREAFKEYRRNVKRFIDKLPE